MKFAPVSLAAVLLLPVSPSPASGPNTLTPAQVAEGWTLLFDGKSFDGWRVYGRPGPPTTGWAITDACLRAIPKTKGEQLITEKKFGDFELRWEWRIAPAGNSGIKYLVTEERPKAPGHEYQMLDDEKHLDAFRGDSHKTAAFYDVLPPATDKPLKPPGEWNASAIAIRGQRVEHWLNGRQVLAYDLGSEALKTALSKSKFKVFPDFGKKLQGHIMLTYHNDECWFRNIMIRELNR